MERQELGPLACEVDGAVAHLVLDDPGRANTPRQHAAGDDGG